MGWRRMKCYQLLSYQTCLSVELSALRSPLLVIDRPVFPYLMVPYLTDSTELRELCI